ncbi:type III polyketide synthase [Mycobacterium intermedium]|uniref:Type III polyketide synthase n=1 Tax=Mycobacterium intermedium TaxID=28445 RepID=A0A1E3SHT0_MYCIE|nr:3-oxoacyl-[acyl-carrier-protein] synthase III C-terminal domain-containing protein [Mycobacterium intermedium]MCV6964910.1 type III polyketide synthase [Mycobacterium intermedium]ODR01679.1 polyketide synthase [Mycobacterium intermedium]OPE52199.1 type III polyketide synthase [Mycobacterium intermedium]ORA98842.1 type III polyketide synthase [Mycobacterium intermedium]
MSAPAESGALLPTDRPDRDGQHDAEIGLAQLPPAPPTAVAVIESIATGTPSRMVSQADVADRVAELFLDPTQRERIPRVYQKTRIATRQMAVDPLDAEFDLLRREPGTVRDRMNLFYEHAVPLAVDVAGRALAGVPYQMDEIGLVVFVTSTGFIAPGVDVAIVKQLGLPRSVSRVVINFMGCAAAMNAIRTAATYVRAHPAMKALVVCIELCSVNAVFADDINDVVIHSLFGDGCGAVVIGASQVQEKLDPGRVVIRSSFSQLLDDAEDGIVLGVNHNGITCELSENLPDYIYRGVESVIAEVLHDNGLKKSDIDLWAIHPGGPKIIEQSARSLRIPVERAAQSWDVLARFGNMLSVSLMFVLEMMVRQPDSVKEISAGMAFAFAPGVTIEGMLFDIVRR